MFDWQVDAREARRDREAEGAALDAEELALLRAAEELGI